MDYKDIVKKKRQDKQLKEMSELERRQLMTVISSGNKKVADTFKSSNEKLDQKRLELLNNKESIIKIAEVVERLDRLTSAIANIDTPSVGKSLDTTADRITNLSQELKEVIQVMATKDNSDIVKAIRKDNSNIVKAIRNDNSDIVEAIRFMVDEIKHIEVNNEVMTPPVKIPDITIDTKPLVDAVNKLNRNTKQPKLDVSEVVASVDSVKKALNGLSFPVPNYILPFKDTEGIAVQANLDADGNLPTKAVTSSSATVTSVASSASSVELLAANASRIEATITNDSTADLYVKLGTTATTSSYTIKIGKDESYIVDKYTGKIDGIWSSATGNARITEVS